MEIKDWLKNKGDYNTGLQLYVASGKANPNLLRLFTKRQTPANFSKLKYELKKISKSGVSIAPIEIVEKPTPTKKVSQPTPTTLEVKPTEKVYENLQLHELPKELRPVYLKQKELFAKATFLHSDLCELEDAQVSESRELAIQIEDIFDEVAICWKQLDYYRDHKLVLQATETDFSNLTSAQLLQKRNNVRANITKHDKTLTQLEGNKPSSNSLTILKKYNSKLRHKEEVILRNKLLLLQLNKLINEQPENAT